MTSDVPEFDVNVDNLGRVSFAHPGQARAYLRAKFGGSCIVAKFYEHRDERTDKQNRAFHAMVWPWAKAEGHRIDDLKDDLLGEIFGYLEVKSPLTGEVKRVLAEPHTSKLSVHQFIQLIDGAMEIAASLGIILVAPDEYLKAKAKAARMAERKARQGATDAA